MIIKKKKKKKKSLNFVINTRARSPRITITFDRWTNPNDDDTYSTLQLENPNRFKNNGVSGSIRIPGFSLRGQKAVAQPSHKLSNVEQIFHIPSPRIIVVSVT